MVLISPDHKGPRLFLGGRQVDGLTIVKKGCQGTFHPRLRRNHDKDTCDTWGQGQGVFFLGGKRPTLVIETNRIGFHGMDLVYFWLVVEFQPIWKIKYDRQIGSSSPRFGVKVKKCLKPPPSEESQRFFFGGGKRPKKQPLTSLTVIETDRIPWDGLVYLPIGMNGWIWLVVSPHLKNICQIGSFPQVGVKRKKYLKAPPRFTDPWMVDFFNGKCFGDDTNQLMMNWKVDHF